jgi:hypothetical protein
MTKTMYDNDRIIKKFTDNDMGKRQIITKHYSLINAQFRLSTVEMKFVLTIISLITRDDIDFFNYQIPFSRFNFLVENNNYSRLKTSCRNLMSRPLEIKTDDGWMIFNWFSKIQYRSKIKVIECQIAPELKPYLLDLQRNFKPYLLEYIMPLKSEYSIRIYELLKQYEKIGKREIKLELLHTMFKSPNSHKKSFGKFNEKVILIAQKELAQHTDIYFDCEAVKETGSKKVIAINFKIYKNIHNIKPDENKEFMDWVNLMRDKKVNRSLGYLKQRGARIKINEDGYLYFDNGEYITTKEADIIWRNLYQMKDKIPELALNEATKKALPQIPLTPYKPINFKGCRRCKLRIRDLLPPPTTNQSLAI